jgi:hypothetical protein
VGETATLTIANESDQTIAFNLSCSLIEERKRVEGWRPIGLKKTCQAYEKMAAPGQESRYQFAIPDTLRQQDARSYRFGTEVTIGERDTLLTTNEFELKGRTKEE